jgi:quercetin dioxygenase-like cupin family protein
MIVADSLLVGQGAGERIAFGGGLVTLKVTSAQSNGTLLFFEHIAARGKATPYHIHPDHDEIAYVLEGELRVNVDGVDYTAGPGDTVHFPRNVPHAFIVTSETARTLWMLTPGEFMEAFLRQAGDSVETGELPSPEIDIPRLVSIGERTGAMRVLGPPPFQQT